MPAMIVIHPEVLEKREAQRKYREGMGDEKRLAKAEYARKWREQRKADPEAVAKQKALLEEVKRARNSVEAVGEKQRQANRASYRKHQDKRKKAIFERRKKRMSEDHAFAASLRLRARAASILKKSGDSRSCSRLYGCSLSDLRKHLESKFADGMSWENRSEWEIDHIYPVSRADVTNDLEVAAVLNWRNIQPLWSSDNRRKSGKVTAESLALFEEIKRILSTPEEA